MAPWQVVGIFCEDIRQEKEGVSLIGILPDNIGGRGFPGRLPKLGIYVRIHIDPYAAIGPISLKIRFPDGSENALGSFDEEFVQKAQRDAKSQGSPWAGLVMNVVAGGITLPRAGRLTVIARRQTEELICAALNIQQAPVT